MPNITNKSLNRIEKSKINTIVALSSSVIMGVFSFVERIVFNQYFIEDYLGLYSFYNNLTGILSTVELGISTSIAFALYEPLEYTQNEQVAAIMHFFKRIYILIGSFIFFAGLLIIPFFPQLVITKIPMNQVKFYFLFYLLRTACNFWFGYRNIIFTANQQDYVVTGVTNLSYGAIYVAEIFITILTKNFLLYSICIAFINLIRLLILNIGGAIYFKQYRGYKKAKIKKETKNKIIKNTKGLIISRLGQVLVNTTDSVLISAMVGTSFLGKYSNYQMIATGLRSLAYTLPGSITASIGNAGITETKRTMSKNFMTLDLSFYFIYGTFTIFMANLFNPIVSTFFGYNRLLSPLSVILICVNFYLTNLREIPIAFKNSLGLYWYDRKRPIIEGITNFIVSIILGYFWGFNGIILGTIFTNLFVNLVIEPRIIFHNGLKTSTIYYYISTCGRFALTGFLVAITLLVNSFIPFTGIGEIIAKATTTSIITLIVFYLIYNNNEAAINMIKTLKIAFSRKR